METTQLFNNPRRPVEGKESNKLIQTWENTTILQGQKFGKLHLTSDNK